MIREDVEPLVLPYDSLCQGAYLRERGEVGQVEGEALTSGRLTDLMHRRVSLGRVASVE